MHVFEEMKRYVGFGPDDEARLRAFWPAVAGRTHEISDHFYDRILAFPKARSVLVDLAQVERLKKTLQQWMAELLQGPWDEAYHARRERIGRVHVDVGLPPRYVFTAMSVVREDLCAMAEEAVSDREALRALHRSIRLVTELDLAIMTGTYIEEREERQIADIQELIVAHMPVSVLLIDAEGRVITSTRSTRRELGVGDGSGASYTRLLPAGLVAAASLEAHVEEALTSRREIVLSRVEASIDGRLRTFRLHLVPLDHPKAQLLLHLEDMTEALETEARVQRSEALAQLGSLSATVAHELRNPLAGISAAVQIIARSLPEDDRRKPVLGRVEDQIRRLNELVTDLLTFARPASARRGPVDLEDVARSVTSLVAQDHPGVTLRLRGEGRAACDKNLVHQILLNLVQNALQAVGDAGEIEIAIAPGELRVSDSGPGIPPEDGERIFTPFFTTRTRGTGLGLAICRKAAASMDAELRLADGGPLPGATFVLSLPVEAGLSRCS